jgi:mono/diheme cytochrome c family protein
MRLIASLLVTSAGLFEAEALEQPSVQRGRDFAQTHCSRCHAVGRTGSSALADAPPFRSLSQRYPLEDLAEPLVEGIQTGHSVMPEWHLDPGDVTDLLAYMTTIQEP